MLLLFTKNHACPPQKAQFSIKLETGKSKLLNNQFKLLKGKELAVCYLL